MNKYVFLFTFSVGILLASSVLSHSVLDIVQVKEMPIEHDYCNGVDSQKSNGPHVAYFGEVWTINKDKSFGAADLDIEEDVYAYWPVEEGTFGEASGYLKLLFANFITNRSDETLSNYRLSTYKITIHDGSSTSDNVIFSDEKEVLENAGDIIGELSYPITVDTKGQSSRDFAVEFVSKTQTILNIVNIPLAGKDGEKEKTGILHLNFNSPPVDENNRVSSLAGQKCLNRSEINVDLGTINLYSTINRSEVPIISTNNVVPEHLFFINRSETPISVNVTVDYSIDLVAVPAPGTLSKILGVKAEFLLEGGYYNRSTNRSYSACSDLVTIPLTVQNLNRSGSFNRSFIVKGTPSELMFSIACQLSYSSIKFWDVPLPTESFDSELAVVKLVYV